MKWKRKQIELCTYKNITQLSRQRIKYMKENRKYEECLRNIVEYKF